MPKHLTMMMALQTLPRLRRRRGRRTETDAAASRSKSSDWTDAMDSQRAATARNPGSGTKGKDKAGTDKVEKLKQSEARRRASELAKTGDSANVCFRAGNTTRDNRHARGMNFPEHVAANKLCPHRRLLPWDLSNSVCTWPASWTQIRGRCMHRDCFDHREHKSIPEGPHALQFGYRLVQVRGGCSFSLEEGRRLHGNLDVLSQEGR